MLFAGKTCIVTGATSGIGRAIALELASQRADLLLIGRNKRRGLEVLAEVRSLDATASFMAADVAQPESARAVVESALSAYGRIDVLVNNAGILINGSALDCTDEDWNRVMEVNVSAAFQAAKAIAPA